MGFVSRWFNKLFAVDPKRGTKRSISTSVKRPRKPKYKGEIHKDREFWFWDGNLILEAEGVHFCIHQSVLHSAAGFGGGPSFLKTLSPDTEFFNGIPVVKVDEDPEDIRYAFREIMFTTEHLGRTRDAVPTCAEVSAWMRIGYDFNLHTLEMTARRHIANLFPAAFEKWYDTEARFESRGRIHEVVRWIDLAQRFGLHLALPALFIHACVLPEGEAVAAFLAVQGACRRSVLNCNTHARISRYIRPVVPPVLLGMLIDFKPQCGDEDGRCSAGVVKAEEMYARFGFKPLTDPLPRWSRFDGFVTQYGACQHCSTVLECQWKAEVHVIWDQVQSFVSARFDPRDASDHDNDS